jgi:hypothetical protein
MKLLLAALALVASATVIDTTPASARDFPYCIVSRGTGSPGDCSYRSYRECMATASGRAATCQINPRVAFDRQHRRYR